MDRESAALRLCQALFGTASLVKGTIWTVVDPIVIALPLAALTTVCVSLLTPLTDEVPIR